MIGQKFVYKEAGIGPDKRTLFFQFQVVTDKKTFDLRETIEFPLEIIDSYENNQLIRALHISLGMSYYKTFIPPSISHNYYMTAVEASFWNNVFKNGYGEFLYLNEIDYESLAKFTEQDGISYERSTTNELSNSALLGIGGGKDSIVAGELLKTLGIPTTGFVQATGEVLGQAQAIADTMAVNLLPIKRKIDQQIIEMNKLDGARNGHIPISLIFGLTGALLALNRGDRYIIVANEASASIPQAKWMNGDVNHQWSKSIEAERLLQDYLHTYVSDNLDYFSIIRPMTSVLVAKTFSKYPKYFKVFTSDNSLLKISQDTREHPRWSTNSSKSLSSFILLAPWVEKNALIAAFGRDFLDIADLKKLFLDLLGLSENTILDCVGTPTELLSSIKNISSNVNYKNSYLVKYLLEIKNLEEIVDLSEIQNLGTNSFPRAIKDQIIKKLQEQL